MKRKANVVIIGIIFILIIGIIAMLIIGFSGFFASFSPNYSVFDHYVGRFKSGEWPDERPANRKPITSGTAKILDYEISVTPYYTGYEQGCQPKPEGGFTNSWIGSDGCRHYKISNTELESVSCDNVNVKYGVWYSCSIVTDSSHWLYTMCRCKEHYQTTVIEDYGGYGNIGSAIDTCWYSVNITKNGQAFDYIPKTREKTVKEYNDFKAVFGKNMYYDRSTSERCYRIENQYSFLISESDIDFEVSTPARQVFQGEEVIVTIKVINNWRDIRANLTAFFEVPVLATPSTEQRTTIQTLKKGETLLTYSIPTTRVTDELRVKPVLKLIQQPEDYSGLNYACADGVIENAENCDTIEIATFTDDTYKVQINPKPIYIELVKDCTTEGCPVGYECQSESGLCLDTIIVENNLTCQQLGCPTVVDPTGNKHHYQCTSAGVCAETVFVYVYQDCYELGCPVEDGQEGECLQNGVCRYIDEITKEVIKEIRVEKNCTDIGCKVIDGVQGVCMLDTGACKYTEKITQEIIKEIQIEKTCADDTSMCPTGTNCDTESKTCIEEHIYTELIQCDSASDCFQPCTGILVSCESNRCKYNGTCEPVYITIEKEKIIVVVNNVTIEKEVPVIKYIREELDCTTLGCGSDDYYCDTDRRACFEKKKTYWEQFFGNIFKFIQRILEWLFGVRFV